MATQPASPAISSKARKTLVRRMRPDRSQAVRRVVQWAFAALNLWLGVQFLLWVTYFERGGSGIMVARPSGVEGWLPIAGLMNSKYFLFTGEVPAVHPAAMFLFLSFLLMSLLVKKAFCSWLCPVGTLVREPAQAGTQVLRPQPAAASVVRYSAPRPEIPVARVLPCFHRRNVDRNAAGFHEHALWAHRRREDAELLSRYEPHCRDRDRFAGAAFDAGAELLVPVPVPLWRVAGTGFASKPGQDPARYRGLHRLRQVRARVPRKPAGRSAGADSLRGVQRLYGMRRRMSGRKCTAVCAAATARRGSGGPLVPAHDQAARRSRAFWPISSLALCCGRAPPITGRPMCRVKCICAWCLRLT